MDFVKVAADEGEEPIGLTTEEDGTLLQSTLQAQFPGSCGLKYRSGDTKAVRAVRLNEGRFFCPSSENGWGTQIYFCVFPNGNKRKSDDNLNITAKAKRVDTRSRCTDLIVLGLPWKTTEERLREHFEEFGDVLMTDVKKDLTSGQSKGFGFVRFACYEAQKRVLSTRHLIDGRWCEVKVPDSKLGIVRQVQYKVFVGRCTEDMTADDLREYFSKFGKVTDVFIPKSFRAFSFVSFLDPEVAQSLCGEDHIVKGVSVHVSKAAPKTEPNRNNAKPDKYNNFNGSPNQAIASIRDLSRHGRDNPNSCINAYVSGVNGVVSSGVSPGGGMGNGLRGEMGVGAIGNSSNGGGVIASSSSASNPSSVQDGGVQQIYNSQNRGGYGVCNSQGRAMLPQQLNAGWNCNRGSLDMPNLQALGINPQAQNLGYPLGFGLDLSSLQMNQWGFIGNLQSQSQEQVSGGGNEKSNQSGPASSVGRA